MAAGGTTGQDQGQGLGDGTSGAASGGVPGGALGGTPGSSPAAEAAAAPTGTLPGAATSGSAAEAMRAATELGSAYPPAASCATCPERSVRFKLGWTFYPGGVPKGSYQMIPGMSEPKPIPANGKIVLDRASKVQVPALVMRGELVIQLDDGPRYSFDVNFSLPAIHEPTGVQRRLTNLGLYAGNDEFFGGRALWAIRAFKRIYMNDYARNATIAEDDRLVRDQPYTLAAAVMAKLQSTHGAHPGDNVGALTPAQTLLRRTPVTSLDAGMFGPTLLRRGSYESAGTDDDADPKPGAQTAVWNGVANPVLHATKPGYEICLGTYDEALGEKPVENHVNLPQPVHMLQFALFETGFWVVAGPRGNGRTITAFGPASIVGATNQAGGRFGALDGGFQRSTQWGVREFQCHAKMPKAAVEDLSSTAPSYTQRLIRLPAETLTGTAQYPEEGRVSGAVNDTTGKALQHWLDRAYRCPVLVYAAPVASYLDPPRFNAENIWRYNDWNTAAPRIYALDLGENYDIPAPYDAEVTMDGQTIRQPITVGTYINYTQGGTYGGAWTRPGHVWNLETTEVSPLTVYGQQGLSGDALSAAQLSTFKVIRAAAHYECQGHYDCMNAYDRVTLSFGLCHWTLAVLGHGKSGPVPVDEAREMGGLFSYMASIEPGAFRTAVGRYGMAAQTAWPLTASWGAYVSRITMQTESGEALLCGANFAADRAEAIEDNRYGHNWLLYYRMLMANKTVPLFQQACGKFARLRIRNILGTAVGTGTVGDYLTSEKAVAMAYRAHIYTTSSLSSLVGRLKQIAANHPTHSQAREELAMTAVESSAAGDARAHATAIRGWTNIPQNGVVDGITYRVNLTSPAISGTVNSFQLDPP